MKIGRKNDYKDYLYQDIVAPIKLAKEEGYSNDEILSALMQLISEDVIPYLTREN